MYTFDNLKDSNLLLYHYIGGSHLYNLNNEDSDIDTKGIFMCKLDDVLGIGIGYQDQVQDSKNDNVAYEIGKFVKLLSSSNPTVMEALFVPEDKMLIKPDPILAPLFENRKEFLSKQCFNAINGYAYQQIQKAAGLGKKMMNPIEKRLTPFDFAYTFYKQGSTKVKDWLDNRGLDKDLCGLVHVPNMHDTYGIYYDWGKHIEKYNINEDSFTNVDKFIDFVEDFFEIHEKDEFVQWLNKHSKPIGYRGICLEEGNDMRLSSVSKGEKPICNMVYNESGYKAHCIYYKEYQDWVKNRNPKRYESNLNHNYDAKNMMHCMRLMHMGLELAESGEMNLVRTWDREMLMNIRNHKYEYEEVLYMAEESKKKLEEAIKTCKLKDKLDPTFANDILIEIRKKRIKL